MNTLQTLDALRQQIALEKQKPADEPVAWVDLLKEAEQIVRGKFLWKKFIDGTPLANDIPCWMADFAQQYIRPQPAAPDSDDQIIRERDEYHEMADDLASRIAEITGVDIGEHSSANCPWSNALDAADNWTASEYARPQPAAWVGLTDEEIQDSVRLGTISHNRHRYSIRGQQVTPADDPLWHVARAIEAKLKEKSHA